MTSRCARNSDISSTIAVGLPRDQEREQPLERRQQQRFVDEAGERDQQQDDERQDRQQRVERHGAREQEALVGAEAPDAQHVLRSFRANQGLLLAGAVAYYALLSLVPLLILVVIALSHFMDPQRVLATIADYLEFIAPGLFGRDRRAVAALLAHRDVMGGLLLASCCSSARSHSPCSRTRCRSSSCTASTSAAGTSWCPRSCPYLFILFLAVGLLAATVVSGRLAVLATRDVALLGTPHSLEVVSRVLLYVVGVVGEVLVVTSIYLVMPVGSMRWRHALIGGVTACLLWEITRHVLVWYYATLSQIQVVYGSFAAAIAVLLSVEVAAVLLLFGAQVIANYERLSHEDASKAPGPPAVT